MPLRNRHHLLLSLSTLPTVPTSLKWRNQIQHYNLVSQISTILLQRKNWIPLLKSHPSLLSNPTPDLIFQILTKTQSHPQISLRFFTWAQSNLGFLDLKSHCKLIQILLESNLLKPANHFLNPILQSEPVSPVLDSMVWVCRGTDSRSRVLSFVLEKYCDLKLVSYGLETLRRIRVCNCLPSTRSCNALLDGLRLTDDVATAWCVYAVAVRSGVESDCRTWSVLAQILCKEGKLERVVKFLNLGFCRVGIYDLVIDCYCRRGDFRAAIELLNGMQERNLRPGFRIYSSILDGGCKFGDVGVINSIVREMVVRELLPTVPFLDYDFVIQRLCEVEKAYAAEMFFERARNENFELEMGSYAFILRVFSKEGRVKEAVEVHGILLEKGVGVNPSCCDVFLSGICKEEPSQEIDRVLKDVIGGGFVPSVSDLSKYIAAQCSKGWWVEASDLLNVALQKGILPDAFCCCSLVEHYCANRLVDSAIALHYKMKKLGASLDLRSYNALLEELLVERRIEEAIQVFDYMRGQNVVSSDSYSIMIDALSCEKELRKAMKLHDEMLKLGLKPDDATYKHLISRFA